MIQKTVENVLLGSIPAQTFEALSKGGDIVPLAKGTSICQPDGSIQHCWFPLSGLVSIVAMDADGNEAEVAMISRDGLVNYEAVLGSTESSMRGLVQVEGTALRIKRELLVAELQASPAFAAQMLAYVHSQILQLSDAALACSQYTIAKRLARWLLIAADITGDNELLLTHEALSIMLGVRRAGVTIALNQLRDLGGISLKRSRIVISNRRNLLNVVGDGYRRDHQSRSDQRSNLDASFR